MDYKKTARKLVARHTTHGLSKADAKLHEVISSLGTERNHSQAISTYLRWCELNGIHPNNFSNKKNILIFLEERSEWVLQTTLNQERRAIELVYKQKLPLVKSQRSSILEKRSYTFAQANSIASKQSDKNSLTTLLSLHSGIRAHEACTLLPTGERQASSHRIWDPRRFQGLSEYQLYTVKGKGGLIREVAVPIWLSHKLEERRISPRRVVDRGIYYEINYEIGFGQSWSQSFTSASRKALGYSTGGHGLRHSYAKWRLNTLIDELSKVNKRDCIKDALLILSQELGHFRLEITFCYLR